jgi:RimJ/RimL family protein N-acetyltransferase
MTIAMMRHMMRTERLVMREWRASDREPFAQLNADPEVMRHFPERLSREQSDAFADTIEAGFEERGWGLWALEVDGAFIGYTGLQPVSFDAHFTPAVEIGWRLARGAWGHGYASEAARSASAFAFAELELDELVSFTVPGNERSRAVMERIGMTHDPAGDFDHPRLPEGHEMRRHVLYRLPEHRAFAARP